MALNTTARLVINMASLRSQVLRLYKDALKLSKNWEAKEASETELERIYISREVKRSFRENAGLSSNLDIEAKLVEGKGRLDVAKHYQIPYPRPIYYATGSLMKQNKKTKKGS